MPVISRLGVTELSPAWMARALGVLYLAGGSLAIVWTVLPRPGATGSGVVLTMALLAVALGGCLVLGPTDGLPTWALHLILAVIQVVISVAYVAAGDPGNDLRLFYAWATPYAAFFFGRRDAWAHSLFTAVCLTVSLVLLGGPPAVAAGVWLMTLGTVAAVGTLVSVLAGRMRAGQQLLHDAAVRDPLTGLLGRRGFAGALDDALAARAGGSVVVLLIDLDHFKLVNDSYGHHVGDQLLVALAPRLLGAVRECDAVARMGGDEFAVVGLDVDGTLDLDALVARLEQVWAEPVALERGPLTVSGSVGVVRGSSPGDTAESLLRDADVALYRAKAVQRGSSVVFDESLRADLARGAQLDSELRGALGRGELSLAFQPVVDLVSERIEGAEALLRWTSPQLGVVAPSDFVPVAEDLGLIAPIGAWVVEEVCGTLAAWRDEGVVDGDFSLAVNVSGRQVRPGFAALVADALARHGLPARVLHLEITESVLLDESSCTALALDELLALGTPLLLDDFGTGFSSLSYLHRLPLNGLKIDKSFVDQVSSSGRLRTLVASMLAMAEGLHMSVVAEGVETQEVADTLRGLGCRRAQGYLWARPLPLEEFVALARERRQARSSAPAGPPTTLSGRVRESVRTDRDDSVTSATST
ncbi:bifunctional diguanylate cyclase/phosphodiesterase [Nocardioides panacis]|uniref:Bifunctional diguanylate cyclase/phosphodiesterase n=1 Tax=Nocardioides panacis TaxID=2849501 RepID=A0A975SWB5_9ACTN|nr:bifunctional diguanylate cyclase/phosphodiesterase [Nocardioides panacis]QWZ06660.1 bifunctional diguanylate cyclase/phosphodiesterase [Nocardioides panacis]